MATYIVLGNFTDQGIKNIKESPNRLDAAKQLVASHGGELKEIYLAFGAYDLVSVVEAPNDEAVAKVALTLGSLGNVRTTSFRVFPESEYREIVGAIS